MSTGTIGGAQSSERRTLAMAAVVVLELNILFNPDLRTTVVRAAPCGTRYPCMIFVGTFRVRQSAETVTQL